MYTYMETNYFFITTNCVFINGNVDSEIQHRLSGKKMTWIRVQSINIRWKSHSNSYTLHGDQYTDVLANSQYDWYLTKMFVFPILREHHRNTIKCTCPHIKCVVVINAILISFSVQASMNIFVWQGIVILKEFIFTVCNISDMKVTDYAMCCSRVSNDWQMWKWPMET